MQLMPCLVDSNVGCATGAGPCPKGGYNYYMGGTVRAAGAPAADSVVSAGPISLGNTGSKDFGAIADGVIRQTKPSTTPTVLAAFADRNLHQCNELHPASVSFLGIFSKYLGDI